MYYLTFLRGHLDDNAHIMFCTDNEHTDELISMQCCTLPVINATVSIEMPAIRQKNGASN